ncbi:MAG: two-component sensor histidine kinase [Burkholderiales bacterium]|nr:two-component sensor histidine kinase [Burkholderiales bacterium]
MDAATAPASDARPHSLRRRLLVFLLLAIAFFALLQGAGAYRGAVRQADQMFDLHLRQMAHAMRPGGPPPLLPPEDGGPEMDFEIQIWGPDGVQLFRSPRSDLPQSAVLGFSDVTVQGTSYRVYTVQTPVQTVQIAQDMSARNARARALALRAVLPVVLMAPLLMMVVWWVISASLAPIDRARRQVAGRAAGDFSPLADTDLPDEVRPLVGELNLLFTRVKAAFETQQAFVADAAHELRSPLTALKLQAQALRRSDVAGDPAAHGAALARLDQGIARAIHLVEQLLALARAEAGGTEAAQADVVLQDVMRLAIADVLPHAQARDIDLGVAGEGEDGSAAPVIVRGQPEALRALLRNLLDNAIKYTPESGRVDVSVSAAGGSAVLAVEDSGPGIAPAERERVPGRFVRGNDTGNAGGSGLGLAIVQAVAARHGGVLSLGTSQRLGGLRAEVRLPLREG